MCRRGSSAVEFSLVALPFFALILASLQLFVMFMAQQVLETATEVVGREILTGTIQSQGLSQSQFQAAVCAQIPALLKCNGVMVDVQTALNFSVVDTTAPALTYDNKGNVTNQWQFQPGSPGDIVIFRVMYQWPMFGIFGFNPITQQNGTRLLMATAVFKNEFYSQ